MYSRVRSSVTDSASAFWSASALSSAIAGGSSSVAQRAAAAGPERRRRRRRRRVEADERADRAVAADQREGDGRAAGAGRARGSFARSAAKNSTPCRITQFAAAHSDGPRFGVSPTSARTVELPVDVVGDHGPARRRNPVAGLPRRASRRPSAGSSVALALAHRLDQRRRGARRAREASGARLFSRAAKSARRRASADHRWARRQAWWRSVSPLAGAGDVLDDGLGGKPLSPSKRRQIYHEWTQWLQPLGPLRVPCRR